MFTGANNHNKLYIRQYYGNTPQTLAIKLFSFQTFFHVSILSVVRKIDILAQRQTKENRRNCSLRHLVENRENKIIRSGTT